ncbi:MAG: hypothetical protein ABIW76_14815, partial [Fibrobacteria bacterium]
MLAKMKKRFSEKRPRGAKLMKLVGILSVVVWAGSGAAFFLVKHKLSAGEANGHGHDGAMEASGHAGHEGAEAPGGDIGDHGVSLASVSEAEHHGNPEAGEGDGGGEGLHGADPEAGHNEPVHAANVDGGEGEAPKGHSLGHAGGHGDAHGDAHSDTGSEGEEPRYQPSRDELAALRQVVELLYDAGSLEKAVVPLRKVLAIPTREIPLLAMATDVFLGTANYQEALATAEQVLALNPEEMTVRVQAVEAQYRMGEIEKAFAGAHAALKAHPDNLAMLTTLGTMEVEMGPGRNGYGSALTAALKLKPDYVPAVYLSGRKAQLEGDYKDAEAAFRKVVRLDPRNAKAFGQL